MTTTKTSDEIRCLRKIVLAYDAGFVVPPLRREAGRLLAMRLLDGQDSRKYLLSIEEENLCAEALLLFAPLWSKP